jgi:5-methylcytosine-specific restriction endonuclease McrA
MTHAFIDALVRLDHRTLAAARSESRRIPRDVAAVVWARDRGRCNECGASPGPGVQLAFDHIIPVALGGATTVENLQVLCTPCNLKKGSRL